ncbi:MAG: helix-turn-helix transcriptional regulator [Planctomycetota bacterium]
MNGKLRQLGERLREARVAVNLSQEELAHRLGTVQRSITRWECGKCEPGFVAVGEIARICGVSLDWLSGATPSRAVLKPGAVLVDRDVLDTLEELAEKGASPSDIPESIWRRPGIDYAFVVPQRLEVLPMVEARKIDESVQQWVKTISKEAM